MFPGVLLQVVSVFTSDECFLALLESNQVTTWGKGELLFCHDQSVRSENYVSFRDVKVLT